MWYSLFVLCLVAAAEPARTIPFELYANAIWFAGRVNGSGPLHILLDTAAGGCVINRSKLDALKLPALSEWDQLNAGSGDNPTLLTRIPSVRIEFGGIALQPVHPIAIPLDEVANSFGAPMDAIVGFELLERYVVRIDYDARTLTLYDPKEYRYDGGGAVLPLEVRANVPVVRAKIGLPGKPAIEGEFLVDAPYPGAVQFATPFVRRHDLRAAALVFRPRLLEGQGAGVGGKAVHEIGRIASIQLGPYLLKLPTAAFANAKAGAFARTDIAGILGGELLRRFRVTLDYSRQRMILEPTAHLGEPFEADASGLLVEALGPPYREFTVSRVAENTPAAEAGIRVGDRLLEIAGRPVSGMAVWEIRRLLRNANQQYALSLRRGEETLRAVLKTRQLL